MIIVVAEGCEGAPDTSVYILDTTKMTNKVIANRFETEDLLGISSDEMDQFMEDRELAQVSAPCHIDKVVQMWLGD